VQSQEAEQALAGDGVQRALRFRFQPRLKRGVRRPKESTKGKPANHDVCDPYSAESLEHNIDRIGRAQYWLILDISCSAHSQRELFRLARGELRSTLIVLKLGATRQWNRSLTTSR
jgi:hypothetical protein